MLAAVSGHRKRGSHRMPIGSRETDIAGRHRLILSYTSRAVSFLFGVFLAGAFRGVRFCAVLRTRARAIVTERIVTLTDGLAKSRRLRTRDKIEGLLRMPRDAVEKRADQLRGREPHVLRCVIAEQLQHLELICRHLRHPLRECVRARVKFVVGHRFQDESDPRGLWRRDFISGEQVALRALETHPIYPNRGGRRAPYSRRRIAERSRLARDYQISA